MRAAALSLAVVAALVACGERATTVRERAPSAGRLYLAGDGELWIVDAATGRTRHLRERRLAPGDPPYRVVRRGRRLVLWGYTTYVADAGFRGPLHALARRSWFFIPSAAPDRVWIAFLDRRSPATVNALKAVREVATDGRVTVPDVRPPGGRWPERALASGLLVGARRGLELWDPRTRRVVRRLDDLGDLGPAHGDLLASCPWPCRVLRLTDVRTGTAASVAAPRGFAFEMWAAAFSPGGSQLAVAVRRPGAGAEQAPRRLALVDVGRRAVRTVPGSRVPSGYNLVAWSASGRDVFITGGERFAARTIVVYRAGAGSARRLPARVGDFYDIAAL